MIKKLITLEKTRLKADGPRNVMFKKSLSTEHVVLINTFNI